MGSTNVRLRRWAPLALTVSALVAALLGVGPANSPAADAAADASGSAPPAGCAVAGMVTTCTFGYTGTWQTWTVPAHVDKATFTVIGASGGFSYGTYPGRGGGVVSTLAVSPGTAYRLYVGGRGGNADDLPATRGLGGFNGGGNGAGWLNPNGAGGGGASDVRYAPYTEDQRILVGGGGGGAGTYIHAPVTQPGRPGVGGNGGGTGAGAQGTNVSGAPVGAGGGGGGTPTAPGLAGGASGGWIDNACGFWNAAIPVAGNGGVEDTGGPGGYNKAFWDGARCDQVKGWGGGGGGGWYGGGGGGGGASAGAGGGGGSGHAPPGSGSTTGQPNHDGTITITYVVPTQAWSSLGGTMTSAPTLTARPHTGKLLPVHDLFYLGPKNQVVQRVITEGTPSPEYDLGATLHPGSTIAAAWRADGQRLDLFGRGTENALWQKTFTWAGGWGAWHVVPEAGTLSSDPSVVRNSLEDLTVFYMGDTLMRMPIYGSKPLGPFPLDGTLDGGPAAVARGEDTVHVFGYGQGESQPDSTFGQWRAGLHAGWHWWPSPNPDDRPVTSTAAAFSPDPQTVTVVIRTDGFGLAVITGKGDDQPQVTWGPWHDYDAPSPAGTAPALLSTPDGRGIVYLRGHDNTLQVRVLDLL